VERKRVGKKWRKKGRNGKEDTGFERMGGGGHKISL
jgi:hypothetical protein